MLNQEFYNRLTISDFLLQIITMMWVQEDATNNDLMKELQRQDTEYFKTIIQNQEKILDRLAKLESKG